MNSKTFTLLMFFLFALSPLFKGNDQQEENQVTASSSGIKEIYKELDSFSPEKQIEVKEAVIKEEKKVVQPDTYIEMISTDGCGACVTWKRDIFPELTEASEYWKDIVRFKTVSFTTKGYTVFPSFDIYVKGKKVKTLGGYVSPSTLANTYNKAIEDYKKGETEKELPLNAILIPKYPLRSSNWSYNGHQFYDRQEAIDHLLNDGVHQNKFTRQQLEAMSLAELKALHSDDHEGRVKYESLLPTNKSIYRINSYNSLKTPSKRPRGFYSNRNYYCPTCPKG